MSSFVHVTILSVQSWLQPTPFQTVYCKLLYFKYIILTNSNNNQKHILKIIIIKPYTLYTWMLLADIFSGWLLKTARQSLWGFFPPLSQCSPGSTLLTSHFVTSTFLTYTIEIHAQSADKAPIVVLHCNGRRWPRCDRGRGVRVWEGFRWSSQVGLQVTSHTDWISTENCHCIMKIKFKVKSK